MSSSGRTKTNDFDKRNNEDENVVQKDSYELDEILESPSSADYAFTAAAQRQKDQKGKLIVDTYLEKHHRSQRTVPTSNTAATAGGGGAGSGKNKKGRKKLDEYGFIVNIDDKGTLRNEDSFYVHGGASTPDLASTLTHNKNHGDNALTPSRSGRKNPLRRRRNNNADRKHNSDQISYDHHNNTSNQQQQHQQLQNENNHNLAYRIPMTKSPSDPTATHRNNKFNNQGNNSNTPSSSRNQRRKVKIQMQLYQKREKKWIQMINEYPVYISSKPKRKKFRSRVRKGIPNSIRGKAWVTMANVNVKIKNMNGVYADLVEQSCTDRFDGIHAALIPHLVKHGREEGGGGGNDQGGGGGGAQQHRYNEEGGEPATDATNDITRETIERDINRTYPRHSMFYDSYSDSDDEEEEGEDDRKISRLGMKTGDDDDNELSDESFDKISFSGSLEFSGHGGGGGGGEIVGDTARGLNDSGEYLQNGYEQSNRHDENANSSNGADELLWTKSVKVFKDAACGSPVLDMESKKENALVFTKEPSPPAPLPPTINTPTRKEKKKVDFATEEGGQASLRRVLRAYSLYDPDVGYCQGMNFIAGMFITFVSEEEAFWLLVYVMNAKPCRMRGLFGVGMSEAHQVLYVAERLIAHFNPKLSKHFDKENIHVTMFVTQWLLTMYTSSFPFHIVTRVWDCFILEGWKVTYRVMLAVLDKATPDLLKLGFEDILNYFKLLPFQINVNALFVSAFNVPLKKRHIEKYAKEWIRKQEIEKLKKEQN
jgi:hypothetical protein